MTRNRFTPALTLEQVRGVASARRRGVPARSLASQYGVHVRTIYRAVERADEPTVEVHVGNWRAPFAITEEGPVQIEGWRPR